LPERRLHIPSKTVSPTTKGCESKSAQGFVCFDILVHPPLYVFLDEWFDVDLKVFSKNAESSKKKENNMIKELANNSHVELRAELCSPEKGKGYQEAFDPGADKVQMVFDPLTPKELSFKSLPR